MSSCFLPLPLALLTPAVRGGAVDLFCFVFRFFSASRLVTLASQRLVSLSFCGINKIGTSRCIPGQNRDVGFPARSAPMYTHQIRPNHVLVPPTDQIWCLGTLLDSLFVRATPKTVPVRPPNLPSAQTSRFCPGMHRDVPVAC